MSEQQAEKISVTEPEVDNTTSVDELEQQQRDEIDYKAWYNENKPKVENTEAILAKNRELLGKMAKTKEQKAVIEKRLEEQAGNWEKLYKDQQEKIRDNTVKATAREIGLKYAGDSEAAEALAELVEKRVAEIINEDGVYEIDDLEALKKDIETNKKYSRLLGNQNKGVGSTATGNVRSNVNSSTTELTYEQYKQLNPMQKLEFARKQSAGKAKLV